jgi:hypothetical protein
MEIFKMAKVLLGPIIGNISGSIGGATYSHNRFGFYVRQKVKPVLISNEYTTQQRAIFKLVTSAWKSLTPANALCWNAYAQNTPVMDKMGRSVILTGHQCHQMLNINAMRTAGTLIVVPPLLAAPAPLTSLIIDPSIAADGPTLEFLKTPCLADEFLQIDIAISDSPNVKSVNSLFKRCSSADAALISPLKIGPVVTPRWGTIFIGQRIHARISIITGATGLQSAPLIKTAVLTA